MKTVKILQEERGAISAQIKAFTAKASAENRNVTDEELEKMKDLSEQRDALDKEIAKAQFLKEEELRQAADEARNNPNFTIGGDRNKGGEQGEKRKLRTEFSFRDAIRSASEQRQPDGLNKEVIEAGVAEANAAKRSITGIAIPSFMMAPNNFEQRAQSVGTSTQSGALVVNEIGEVIEYLYPRTVLREMGVNFLSGLTSNIDLIRQNGAASATWEGENDDNANTDPTVESVPMRPKRLGAETIIGKQLMFQSKSISVENWIRNNLNIAQGVALETAALNGSGTAPIPTGLLNTSGINAGTSLGTNGGAPTWNSIVELESLVADDNADYGTLAYLTTAIMRGKLKTTEKASSTAQFIWAMNEMNGYRSFVSTLVPKTLIKGTSTDCHAIIFGNWAELYIGQWDGLDVVVDPYTLAGKAQIKITVNGWYDIALRHKESFAVIKDARNV